MGAVCRLTSFESWDELQHMCAAGLSVIGAGVRAGTPDAMLSWLAQVAAAGCGVWGL